MFRNITLAVTALAIGSTALVAATPASAQRHNGGYYGNRHDDNYRSDYRRDRRYHDNDRRYYRDNRRTDRCSNATGTVIGAIAGGLLGNSVAGRGDRTLGAVLGAGAGALAGRSIDRSDDPRYCRR